MSTDRDHQADQPVGQHWDGWRKVAAYRFGRQDTVREGLEVLRSKGEAGLAAWIERLARNLDTPTVVHGKKTEGER